MRYAQIRSVDITNGQGIGVALFVQGCHFHCENCFNQQTWDFNGGSLWTKKVEQKFIQLAENPHITRISILGGEPLCQENIGTVILLCEKLKNNFKTKNKKIWIYTGYVWEQLIITPQSIPKCDVIVDGRFIKELQNFDLQFRGSSNQRIIDVEKSLTSKGVKLWQV